MTRTIATGLVTYGLSSALSLDQQGVSPVPAAGPARLRRLDGNSKLPGQPWVDLRTDELLPYLRKALLVETLDKVTPYLWLVRGISLLPFFSAVSPTSCRLEPRPKHTYRLCITNTSEGGRLW